MLILHFIWNCNTLTVQLLNKSLQKKSGNEAIFNSLKLMVSFKFKQMGFCVRLKGYISIEIQLFVPCTILLIRFLFFVFLGEAQPLIKSNSTVPSSQTYLTCKPFGRSLEGWWSRINFDCPPYFFVKKKISSFHYKR